MDIHFKDGKDERLPQSVKDELACKTYLEELATDLTPKEPRAYTVKEVRDRFLENVHDIGNYWSNINSSDILDLSFRQVVAKQVNGALFSTLSLIDGSNIGFPAFDLVVRPHEEDKQYCIDNGENYYEDGMCINDDVFLHHLWYTNDDVDYE